MKILVALDTTEQSAFVLQEVARLAHNTWADVTLLGVAAEVPGMEKSPAATAGNMETLPLVAALRKYREDFLAAFEGPDSPYAETAYAYELVELQKGLYEDLKVCRGARKHLRTRIRFGSPARALLAEARQSLCDLIVVANAGAGRELGRTAQKVIREAEASVLAVAEAKKPRRIVACLDHDHVSQPSLEMINQLVTLYRADLEIVGVTNAESLPGDVEHKMGQVLKYYAANGIKALVRLVAETSLENFAAQAARENLMALWMGKTSLLQRFLPLKRVDRLLTNADSSLLILR